MSNFLTIATVTEVLKQTLETALSKYITGARLSTALRPNSGGDKLPDKGVNIYLYQVNPSPAGRNLDLPSRNSNGTLTQRPRIALDLYYLLSFYGDEANLEPQQVLGCVTSTLHARPILTRDSIRSVINNTPYLKSSDLDQEVELIKFTLLHLSLEELSKLWSVFFQTTYTLSVVYQASIAFIEGEERDSVALPVRERNIRLIPFRKPVIDKVSPQFVTVDEELVIGGQNLSSEGVSVFFKSVPVTPDKEDREKTNDRKIAIEIPPDLRAGVNTVQVVHDLDLGTTKEPHRVYKSNIASFVLRPAITITVTNEPEREENGVMIKEGNLSVGFRPKVGKHQRVILFLDQLSPPSSQPPNAFSLKAPAENGIADQDINDTDIIHFPFKIKKSDAGEYLVHVLVDEAQSEETVGSI